MALVMVDNKPKGELYRQGGALVWYHAPRGRERFHDKTQAEVLEFIRVTSRATTVGLSGSMVELDAQGKELPRSRRRRAQEVKADEQAVKQARPVRSRSGSYVRDPVTRKWIPV